MKRSWLALPALVALLACEPEQQRIGAGSHPQSGTVQVSKDGSQIFVLSEDHRQVLVFDRGSRQVVRQIDVGDHPVAITVLKDGRIAVANQGSNSVSIVNPQNGESVEHFVGIEPTAVAAWKDQVVVTLGIENKLILLDPTSGAVVKSIELNRKQPAGLAVLSNNLVYVSHFFGHSTDQGRISVVDVEAGTTIKSIPVSMPSNQLLRANQLASLTVAPDEDEVSAPHQETNNDPGGFNTSGPPAATVAYYAQGPSGMPAVVPAVSTIDPRTHANTSDADPPNSQTCIGCGPTAGTADPKDPSKQYAAPAIHNVFELTTFGDALLNQPIALAYVDGGKGKLVVYRGSNNVVYMRRQHFGNQDAVISQYKIGQGASGIAVSQDGKKAYVWSQFDYELHEIDVEPTDGKGEAESASIFSNGQDKRENRVLTTSTVRTMDLRSTTMQEGGRTHVIASRPASISHSVDSGRRAFFGAADSKLTIKGAVACASCHPGGRTDGMNWTFGTAKVRNTPQLGGGISDTAPFHWQEGDREDKASMNMTVNAFMGGTGLEMQEINDLFAFIDTIPVAQSPIAHKPEMQDAIARGAAIFFSEESECIACHSGSKYTDNKFYGQADVQTAEREQGIRFNTPVLAGLAVSGPYFHDGRDDAQTLEQLVDNYVKTDKMGKGSHLSPEQLADLVAFLKSI